MLETIRQYANEKLVDSGESEAFRGRHLEFFLNLAETAAPHLIRLEQLDWLLQLDAEQENLRAALELAVDNEKVESALSLCVSLTWFWQIRGYWKEGLSWMKKALALAISNADISVKIARSKALYSRALIEWEIGNIEEMWSPAEESLELATEVSGKKDLAIARFCTGVALIISKNYDDKASKMVEQSFTEFQQLNEPFWVALTYISVGATLVRYDKIKLNEYYSKLVEFARNSGERLNLADALSGQGRVLLNEGQMDKAKESIEESDLLYKLLRAENNNLNLLSFAEIARNEGNYRKAKSLFKEMDERLRLIGEKFVRETCNASLGRLAMEEGKLVEAQDYFEESLLLAKETGVGHKIARALANQGNLFHLQGKIHAFKENARKSLSFRDSFTNYFKARILSIFLFTLSILELESSASILGAMDNFQKERGEPLWPEGKHYYDLAEKRLREVLDDETFESAFAEGQKMSLDDALDLVLKIVEEME
jgi:tetratricopeptide (TPR) repeat protein